MGRLIVIAQFATTMGASTVCWQVYKPTTQGKPLLVSCLVYTSRVGLDDTRTQGDMQWTEIIHAANKDQRVVKSLFNLLMA